MNVTSGPYLAIEFVTDESTATTGWVLRIATRINGNWSVVTSLENNYWNTCNGTCSFTGGVARPVQGKQTLALTCTDPAPLYGGANCPDNYTYSRNCNSTCTYYGGSLEPRQITVTAAEYINGAKMQWLFDYQTLTQVSGFQITFASGSITQVNI